MSNFFSQRSAKKAAEADARRRQQRHDKIAEGDAARRESTAIVLAGSPQIELVNPDLWARDKGINSNDPEGRAVFEYAEQWARLMQLALYGGAYIGAIADITAREADDGNMSGFMHNQAVQVLRDHWRYGQRLWRWHLERGRI